MSAKHGPQLVEIEWRTPDIDELHPLVQERLRALGADRPGEAPDVQRWHAMLQWVSRTIGRLEEDRKRLAISIEVEHELCNLVTSERRQHADLEREVKLAADVQRTFVPRAHVTGHPKLQLSSFYQPAASCGGDWWSRYELPGDRIMIVIGDVTGHGVAPAMMTGVVKGAADVIARNTPAKRLTPARMLRELNLSVCNAGTDSLLMTCAVALIDPASNTVTFASAGHPLPYVVRERRGGHALKQLVANGNPLGTSERTVYADATMSIGPGDAVIWYTDGVLDIENDRGEPFGERRFRHVLRNVPSIAPSDLSATLRRALCDFMGKANAVDDVTFVVARLRRNVSATV